MLRAITLSLIALVGCDDSPELAVDAGTPDAEVSMDVGRAWAESAAATIDADWLLERVAALADDSMAGRDNQSPGGERAREWLAAQLEAAGAEPVGDGWFHPFAEGSNVVAVRRGVDPNLADEYVVVGAHYDHLGRAGDTGAQCVRAMGDSICNGAVDNATGCAAVLAVARALGTPGGGPRRSVLLVFFDAEEDGLLGSRHLVAAREPIAPAEMVAMFNLDMVGASIIPGAEASFALGVEYATGIGERVLRNAEHVGQATYPVSSFFDGSEDGERSDHHPFRGAGVPALFFSSGAPAVYHSPADEVGQVEPEKLRRTTQQVFLTVTDVANADDRPGFVDPPARHLGDARALLDLGSLVVAEPEAVGLDPMLVGIVESWLVRLRGYLETPPETEAQWDEYERFVRAVVGAVVNATGR